MSVTSNWTEAIANKRFNTMAEFDRNVSKSVGEVVFDAKDESALVVTSECEKTAGDLVVTYDFNKNPITLDEHDSNEGLGVTESEEAYNVVYLESTELPTDEVSSRLSSQKARELARTNKEYKFPESRLR